MERKTIGAFIAALRKANGMTQQELADMLNISNKAVSRWERDECAPDITLIPALAEILGVTCDELLKGERITSEFQQERSEPKIERQIKLLINRSITKFMILICISFALSAAGLICMFGILFGAGEIIIAYAVMGVFVVSAFILAAIAITKLKGVKSDNELFENAGAASINRFNKTLGNYSFAAFFSAITVVAISLPLLFMGAYVFKQIIAVLFALGIVWIGVKDKYCILITEQPYKINLKFLLMNALQLVTIVAAIIMFMVRSSYEYFFEVNLTLLIFAICMLVADIIIYIVFMAVCKADRKKLALFGLRNLFLIIPSVLTTLIIQASVVSGDFYGLIERYWNIDLIVILLAVAFLIFLVFDLINKLIRNLAKNKEV